MGMAGKIKELEVNTLVFKMTRNSQDMRQWKNVALAEKCLELLKNTSDKTVSPLRKARACNAIVEQLPCYDVPRFTLTILRYERELLERSDETPEKYDPTLSSVGYEIQRLEDYIDTEHVAYSTFREKYGRHLEFDSVERTEEWEANYVEVEQECDRRLGDTPRGMGFCFAYWSTLSDVLSERGIHWRSPHQMNPRVMFD